MGAWTYGQGVRFEFIIIKGAAGLQICQIPGESGFEYSAISEKLRSHRDHGSGYKYKNVESCYRKCKYVKTGAGFIRQQGRGYDRRD